MELKKLTFLTFGLIILSIILISILSAWAVTEIFLINRTSRTGLVMIASLRKIQGETNDLLITEDLDISYLHWLESVEDFGKALDDFYNSPRLNTLVNDQSINTNFQAFRILTERARASIDNINSEYLEFRDLSDNENTGLFINSAYNKDKNIREIADSIREAGTYFSTTYENTIFPLVSSLETKSLDVQKRIIVFAGIIAAVIIILTTISIFLIRKEENRIKDERLNIEMQMNKFELLKYFAGGIAHDFNNYLGAIYGNISIAKTLTEAGSELSDILNDVGKASEQAIGLTKQFMVFSKGKMVKKEIIDVKETLKSTAGFILRGSSIKCEYSFAQDLLNIEIDESRFCEVINNILINSMQAMPEGGEIKISAENAAFRKGNNRYFKSGEYIHIFITDTGRGIEDKIRDKIFTPFFSTKVKGSGLGLAICYTIVQENHGYLDFDSIKDKGTTFNIYLRATRQKIEEKEHEHKNVARGSGRILLMDDDEKILTTVSRMLRQLGYEPDAARNGSEAVELYKKAIGSGRPFKAVILDFTIPGGMGGKETIKELLKIDSEVIAVISSGYAIENIFPDYEKRGFRAYLKKGYSIQDLGETLADVCS